MSAEPIFLTIERHQGRLVAIKRYGHLAPDRFKRRLSTLRLDLLSYGKEWEAMPCGVIVATYERLKANGTWPADNLAIAKKADTTERGVKHDIDWWLPAKTWDDRAPDQVTATHEKPLRVADNSSGASGPLQCPIVTFVRPS